MGEEFITYRGQQIPYLDFLNRSSEGIHSYVELLPWSKNKKEKFINAYRDIIQRGITDVSNVSGEDELGIRDSSGLDQLSEKDYEIYQNAADYIINQISGLSTASEDKKKKDIKKYDHYNNFIDHVRNTYYGGNKWIIGTENDEWNKLDERSEENGLRGFRNRADRMIKYLKSYRDSLDKNGSNYDFEGTPFKSIDDVKERIDKAITSLKDENFDLDDIDNLNMLGLKWNDFFNDGGRDIYATDRNGNKVTFADYYKMKNNQPQTTTEQQTTNNPDNQLTLQIEQEELPIDPRDAAGLKTVLDIVKNPLLNPREMASLYFRSQALLTDIGSLIASFFPQAGGTAIAGVGGLASMGNDLIADVFDPSVGWGEVVKNVGFNTALAGVGLIPGGKAVNIAKRLMQYGLPLAISAGVLKTEGKKTWKKIEQIANGEISPSELTVDDLNSAKNTLMAAMGVVRTGKFGVNEYKYRSLRGNTRTYVETKKGKVYLTEEEANKLDKIGLEKGTDEANAEFQKMVVEKTGISKEAAKEYKLPIEYKQGRFEKVKSHVPRLKKENKLQLETEHVEPTYTEGSPAWRLQQANLRYRTKYPLGKGIRGMLPTDYEIYSGQVQAWPLRWSNPFKLKGLLEKLDNFLLPKIEPTTTRTSVTTPHPTPRTSSFVPRTEPNIPPIPRGAYNIPPVGPKNPLVLPNPKYIDLPSGRQLPLTRVPKAEMKPGKITATLSNGKLIEIEVKSSDLKNASPAKIQEIRQNIVNQVSQIANDNKIKPSIKDKLFRDIMMKNWYKRGGRINTLEDDINDFLNKYYSL